MRPGLRTTVALGALLLGGVAPLGSASGLERGKDGYFHTGDGIRVKSLVLVKLKIYAIGHDMRELPATKSKQAVMDIAKIGSFLTPFGNGLRENQRVVISYASASKTTTVAVEGHSAVSIFGLDFMRATWGIWFGNTDDPALGDALIGRL
jgi:hypothetical protein